MVRIIKSVLNDSLKTYKGGSMKLHNIIFLTLLVAGSQSFGAAAKSKKPVKASAVPVAVARSGDAKAAEPWAAVLH